LKDIILTTINAKWIHPSLALRLLKANLGSLEDRCEIIEFALRQPLNEKIQMLLEAKPRILGISVSIWNHAQTIELLQELEKSWASDRIHRVKPFVVLGGPEVSYLPSYAEIFKYADYVIRGEGETSFRILCENILHIENHLFQPVAQDNIFNKQVNINKLKSAYHLYTDEDLSKKLIYAEASRGCVFHCEFCSSSIDSRLREFPLEPFLAEMDQLIRRGVKTIKFLDRSFNTNIKRAVQIMEFLLNQIELQTSSVSPCMNSSANISPFAVHFEMAPSLFPPELRETLARFPQGTLRLEIGIQSLNPDICALTGRVSNPEKELEALRFLRSKTNAIIHADLIAGLPGEDIVSFGNGFDRLWNALNSASDDVPQNGTGQQRFEIQPGILKLLPGTRISRHTELFGMRFNPQPPYEVTETSSITASDINRLKNFARFWELIVNRRLIKLPGNKAVFNKFMEMSDSLYAHFGRNWGIDRAELQTKLNELKF